MIVSAIAFVVVLGILIFVHELGHFLVAKGFRVGVEKFSLGFGPKLIGKKVGETVYQVSSIPLGGYVKMVGEDPTEELSPEDRQRSFNNQSLLRRFLIVAAGPASNILFAMVIFMGMFMIGYPSEDSTVGLVERDSAAWNAGIRAGDKILSVNGNAVRLWEEVVKQIRGSEGTPLAFEIERHDRLQEVTVQPNLKDGKNLFGEYEKQAVIGISHHVLAPVIGVPDPGSLAGRSGLKTGDLIAAVNGQKVERLSRMSDLISTQREAAIELEVQRGDKKVSVTLQGFQEAPSSPVEGDELPMERLGIFSAELFVKEVVDQSPAAKAGIQAGDRILEIEGEPILSFARLQEMISEKPSVPVSLRLMRDGAVMDLTVTPEAMAEKDAVGNKITVGKIGIVSAYYPMPGPTISVSYNPVKALQKGLTMTWEITGLILVSLVKLIQQVIPAETIGGPILIAQLAGEQVQYGILELFKFMALISINLGILNLLPIPILDGGHIFFFALEGLMGRPLSMRKREIAQQIGLFLLISLMVFAFYNDLMRVFD
ncbi:MAG: RIP metalloprotease RseP [bacterium]|nr:RIP metalloprotease RseP [bacterium]